MSDIAVFGAGAFGTALAISLAKNGRHVSLIARSSRHAEAMVRDRQNTARLPGFAFPDTLQPISVSETQARICLVAVPTQQLAAYMQVIAPQLKDKYVVACCKGVDLKSGKGPTAILLDACPSAIPAILSGPSFATDIAGGLPTALTLGVANDEHGITLQSALSTPNLRIYRSGDVTGVELGGALKNVVAIAAGIAIGAGLGESARAALITRGYAEMKRFASAAGAMPDTLSGLSGFGDLVLTCTSDKSRNFSYGLMLGQGVGKENTATVEGISTAKAVSNLAFQRNVDMPITGVVAKLIDKQITVGEAVNLLLSRPLKKE